MRGAEAGIGSYNLPGGRDTYVDAIGSLVNPVTHPGCESTTGHVAELKARQKIQIIPFFTLIPVDLCIHLIFAQSHLTDMAI